MILTPQAAGLVHRMMVLRPMQLKDPRNMMIRR